MSMLDILPPFVSGKIDSMSLDNNDSLILATLLKGAIREAAKAVKSGDYKFFDANPGDGGCQTRALFFATRNVAPELIQTAEKVHEMNQMIQDFRRKPTEGSLLKKLDFPLSKNGRFALLAFILTCTKAKLRELPNGIVLDQTNIGGLGQLVKNFDQLRLDRQLFVSEMQTQFARMSIEITKEEAAQLGDPHLSKQLLEVRVAKHDNFPEKPSGFLFYQIEALLGRLQQQQSIICIRNVKPVYTFLLNAEGFSITTCDLKAKVVVFEGATTQSKEELEARIIKAGFTTVIRHLAAKEKQFGPQSSIEFDDERLKAAQNPLELGDFTLDHIYVQTLGKV